MGWEPGAICPIKKTLLLGPKAHLLIHAAPLTLGTEGDNLRFPYCNYVFLSPSTAKPWSLSRAPTEPYPCPRVGQEEGPLSREARDLGQKEGEVTHGTRGRGQT